jgi:hypothetical protein
MNTKIAKQRPVFANTTINQRAFKLKTLADISATSLPLLSGD